MNDKINPQLFQASYRKVQRPYQPKAYFSTLTLHGVHYPIKSSRAFRRASDALEFAKRVRERWLRLRAVNSNLETAS